MIVSDTEEKESVDPRILFAAERTLFAYIRTGLALMGFGFVVSRFGLFLRYLSGTAGTEISANYSSEISSFIGIALVVCGVVLCSYSPLWYFQTVSRLEGGKHYQCPRFGIGSIVALLVAFLGAVMAVYLNAFR